MPDLIVLQPAALISLGCRILRACGATADEARVTAEELAEANLMGLDSHGVLRLAQYVDEARAGRARPGSIPSVVADTPTTATLDGRLAYGPYVARLATDLAIAKARAGGVAVVVTRNAHHIGRLGACPQRIAAAGMIGFAVVNSSKHGHFVVPFGGREGRLATNPLAFAAPTTDPDRPVLLDMSTSMIAEGKIRSLMQQGRSVPAGSVQDAAGNPTTDPAAFYGPPKGTILPFGGADLGYKGFGLSLMVEILGGVLAGYFSSRDEPYINGLCVVAINPDAFGGSDSFKQRMDDLCQYIGTTPPAPGAARVVLPGQLDFETRERRLAEGIALPAATWESIIRAGRDVGVEVNA